ncbi:MAG: hypothetical protein FI692_07690 [SAR202 cluster bacterium]|nr:hypothetical protein [SAR202 cluster bacterium]|tara:strand:+ start:387 stop:1253 length:867 start_codon:yes stop_codon:yes gene_type:complete
MDLKNSKVSIGIVIAIIAQAFGIIWYVAQLDSTVSNLDSTVSVMKEQATTINVAVLQTKVESLEQRIQNIADNPQAPEHFHDQQQHFHPEYDIVSSDSHFHSEFNNIQPPANLDGLYTEIQLLKESVNDRKQEIKDMDWKVDELDNLQANDGIYIEVQHLKERFDEIAEFFGYVETHGYSVPALPPPAASSGYDAEFVDLELYRLLEELDSRLDKYSNILSDISKEENSKKSNDTDIDERLEELWVQIDHLNAVTSDASGGAASWRFDEITDKISQLDKDIWELHGHE